MHYSSADVSPFHRILYKVIYQVLRNPAKKKTVPKHDLLRAGNNNKNNNNTADYFYTTFDLLTLTFILSLTITLPKYYNNPQLNNNYAARWNALRYACTQ